MNKKLIFGLSLGFMIAFELVYIFVLKKVDTEIILKPSVFEVREPVTSRQENLPKAIQQAFAGEFKGQVLFLGFTKCPDVCPTTMSLVADILNSDENKEFVKDIQFRFVSIDLENDKPVPTEEYIKSFHPSIASHIFTQEDTDLLVKWVRGSYSPSDTGFFHSSSLFLMDNNGHLIGEFPVPKNSKEISQALKELL